MPVELRVEAAQFWLEYASSDMEAASACWERPSVHGWTIAFHCQQAVEKAYKGALTLAELEVPKTHNLLALHAALADAGLSGPLPLAALGRLTPYAVDDKYPKLNLVPIAREEAVALLPEARVAVQWLTGLVEALLPGVVK